jgi:hypothetical protein
MSDEDEVIEALSSAWGRMSVDGPESITVPAAARMARATMDVFAEGAGRRDMPLSYMVLFLQVVREEGLAVSEYAKRAGVSLSVASLHLLTIGDRDRDGNPGFGLVHKRQDPRDHRVERVFLTDKGAALARRISACLRGEIPA